MANRNIKLVKQWLADNDSVSSEELKANASRAADYAADYASRADAADYASRAADYAARAAADAASYDAVYYEAEAAAAYWVKQYEEMTNEK